MIHDSALYGGDLCKDLFREHRGDTLLEIGNNEHHFNSLEMSCLNYILNWVNSHLENLTT